MNSDIGVYGIYDIRNNELLYLGESTQLTKRLKNHFYYLEKNCHTNHNFQKWFNEQNVQSASDILKIKILEKGFDEKLIHLKEKEWFDKQNPKFYNQIPTGSSKWYVGIVFDEDVRKKISDKTKHRNMKEAPYGRDKNGNIIKKKTCQRCNKDIFVTDPRIKFCSQKCGTLNQFNRKIENDFITKEELINDLKYPTTYQSLAKKYNTSRIIIKKRIKEYKLEEMVCLIDNPNYSYNRITYCQILKAIRDSKTKKEIKEKLGIGKTTLPSLLDHYKIDL